jgi:hypothetical protein
MACPQGRAEFRDSLITPVGKALVAIALIIMCLIGSFVIGCVKALRDAKASWDVERLDRLATLAEQRVEKQRQTPLLAVNPTKLRTCSLAFDRNRSQYFCTHV